MSKFFYRHGRYLYTPPTKKAKKKGFLAKLKLTLSFTFFIVIIFSVVVVLQFDKKTLPTLLVIAQNQATTRANRVIDDAISQTIEEMHLTSPDFFQRTPSVQKGGSYLNVDTLLVNNVCSKIAIRASSELNNAGDKSIEIPSGAFLGSYIFSNYGPKVKFSLLPMGNAQVDYLTSFDSVGINQINFQIWLTIKCTLRIVNPLQDSSIAIDRKVMLVNTIFNGDVPSTYLQLPTAPKNPSGS